MSHSAPTPASCPGREVLAALVRGDLPPAAAHSVRSHLAICTACHELFLSLFEAHETRPRATTEGEPVLAAAVSGERAATPTRPRVDPARREASPGRAGAGPPRRLGRYRIVERLGRGGVGVVYRGWHPRLKKWVAIKLLLAGALASPAAVARFEREMEIVGRLQHPNIIRATDAGDADGYHYLVMDLVEGADLGQLVRQLGPLPVAEACAILYQAALALEHAHAHGLVHRDLKPSNLMLSTRGEVKLLDLGLALLRGEAGADSLTPTGLVMGTADYMAPEQWEASHEVDIRADLYSLGCTLYTLLTGHPPFAAPPHYTTTQKMTAHLRVEPTPIEASRPDVPPAVGDLLRCLLAKDPRNRPQEPGELAAALAPLAVGAELVALVRSLNLPPLPAAPDDAAEAAEPGSAASDAPTVDDPARTVVSEPRHKPAPALWAAFGWLGVGGVLLAAAAVLGVVFAAAALLRTPAGPAGLPPRVYHQGVWTDVLDREPEKRLWWNPDGAAHATFDARARTLSTQTFAASLLTLGRTDAVNYHLQVGLRQNDWPGGCGLFFGARPDGSRPGGIRLQALLLQAGVGPRRELCLCRCAGTVEYQPPAAPAAALPTLRAAPLPPAEPREYVLDVFVRRGAVSEVFWDGKAQPALAAKEHNARFGPDDYRGEFGLVCRASSVSVRFARFMPLE